ncbi:MAG: DUF2142 domain-containing protein [Candidatus Promineifilaceae bacterium]
MAADRENDIKAVNGAPEEVTRRHRLLLALILAGYVIVTLLYGVINPLFEAPDEHWHYFTAQYIAENGRLPYVASGADYDEWLSQEAAQPPLYYLIGALLTSPIDTLAARDVVWQNKFASVGDASALININRFVHAGNEKWPWQGYTLAAHILRWLSTLLGLGTLVCIYLAGRLLWPRHSYRALLATAMVAFLPQYNFLHASVSNDPLIIFLVSAALLQLIRLWQSGISRARLLLLGLTIGLAALSKNAGISLLIYATGVLVLLAIRGQADSTERAAPENPETLSGWRMLGATAVWVVLPAVLLAGWLWIRNAGLYGDFTAMNQFVQIAGGDRDYSLFQVFRETRGLWLSLFAVFGWFNLRAPDWVYWFWSVLVALAVIGAVSRAVKHYRYKKTAREYRAESSGFLDWAGTFLQKDWVLPLLLALWVVLVYASLSLFMLRTEAAQGRLLFPALLPLALGLASGLTATKWLRRLSPLFPLAAFFITLYCLFKVVRPAYETPPTVAELPAGAQEINGEMGQGIRLVGALVEPQMVLPGDPLWLTLYWRGDDVAEAAPEFVLSLFGRDNEEIGKVHSYHGRGLYPAGLWPDGQIVADRFGLWVDEDTAAPVLAVLDATLLDGATVRAGEIKIAPHEWPPLEDDHLAQFGPHIDLLDVTVTPQRVRPGESLDIDVLWQARADLDEDLTTLVHLGQPDETPLATGDRLPVDGRYPTRVWENGEQIDDYYKLALPDNLSAGRYPLWIGMYNHKTMERLPVLIEGEAQPYNVYLAGWVEIE